MLPLLRARVRRYATVRPAPISEGAEALDIPKDVFGVASPLGISFPQLCPKPPHRRPAIRAQIRLKHPLFYALPKAPPVPENCAALPILLRNRANSTNDSSQSGLLFPPVELIGQTCRR